MDVTAAATACVESVYAAMLSAEGTDWGVQDGVEAALAAARQRIADVYRSAWRQRYVRRYLMHGSHLMVGGPTDVPDLALPSSAVDTIGTGTAAVVCTSCTVARLFYCCRSIMICAIC